MIKHGRRLITLNYDEVTDDNIVQIVTDGFSLHMENRQDCQYLIDYDKGNIPELLARKKEVRPEIDNKIVVNLAHYIKRWKQGYGWGNPIVYVQRADIDKDGGNAEGDDRRINRMNEMFSQVRMASKNSMLADRILTTGVGYKMLLHDPGGRKPFNVVIPDPRTTFVVRKADVLHEPLLACTYVLDDMNQMSIATVYTDRREYVIRFDSNGGYTKTSKPHFYGGIPVVEYFNDENRMGCFEYVLDALKALSFGVSDRTNDIEQFINSLIWFNNVDIDVEKFKELVDIGAIQTADFGSKQAKIEMLTQSLNQTDVQTHINNLYDLILTICAIPNSRNTTSGGDTGTATSMITGWSDAETYAKNQFDMFEESEYQFVELVLNYMNNVHPGELEGLEISDIGIKATRDKSQSLLVKTQGLLNLMNAGIHPRHAINEVELFSDPNQVYEDSREYLEKWKHDEDNAEGARPEQTEARDNHIDGGDEQRHVDNMTEHAVISVG